MRGRTALSLAVALAVIGAAIVVWHDRGKREFPNAPMLVGLAGWAVTPVVTIGETVAGFVPPGKPDGMGAYRITDVAGAQRVRVLVNHELVPKDGYIYALANGTQLTGARISYLDIDPVSRAVMGAGLAYETVYDAAGEAVVAAGQINETGHQSDGLGRFCSARAMTAGTLGLVDDIYFAAEEMHTKRRAKGGLVWALDVKARSLWAVPEMGRAAWENVTPIEPPAPGTVAFLLGDDTSGAPLWLYVGRKDLEGGFLARNGLADGVMFAWRAYDVSRNSPDNWNASTGPGMLGGCFIRSPVDGLDADEMREGARSRQTFAFARPEDLHANPLDSGEAVFAATGDGKSFDADNWGTIYRVRPDFERGCGSGGSGVHADISILYDGDFYDDPERDGAPNSDFGLRNPDNLTWSDDGYIYVQEDPSSKHAIFGGASKREASIWRLDPTTAALTRIAEIDRTPFVAVDLMSDKIGKWETSGVIDVTSLFDTKPNERLLLSTVQAHTVMGGVITEQKLVEGGQILFLSGGE